MKRRMLAVLLSSAIVMSLVGCGKEEIAEIAGLEGGGQSVTLVYAEMNPLDTIAGETALAFKEKVEELSDGNIIIDIQHSGVLGDEITVMSDLMNGESKIDMARVSTVVLHDYDCNKTKLLSLPFMFGSHEHFWKFASSDLADEILAEPVEKELGVRGLFYGEEGFRHFFTNKEVNGMEDFVGLKVRVANDAIMNGLVQGLGGRPMMVSFNELYIALKNELVDAAEQPLINYRSNAFPEVASNLILDGHTLGTTEVIISEKSWGELSKQQKSWLEEAGDYAASYNREIAESAEREALEELKAAGVTVIKVEDIAPWQEACSSVISNNIAGMENVYQQIKDMK